MHAHAAAATVANATVAMALLARDTAPVYVSGFG
jgi:hypothetical protein